MTAELTSEAGVLTPIRRKFNSIVSMPKGWHFGEGDPLGDLVVDRVSLLIGWAESLSLEADIFPGLDGTCAVTFYRERASLEVVVDSDGTMDLREGHGYGVTYVSSALGTTGSLGKVLDELTRICLPSDSSTSCTSTSERAVSTTWHSSAGTERYQSSMSSALAVA